MKVLIIGNGGREHAITWKVSQSPQVDAIYVAPGNAGTALEAKTQNVAIDVGDIPMLIQFVKDSAIDLTIIGPEAPLAAGIVDQFQQQGLAIFGPTQQAASLESSKAFCKDFMQKYDIPTATYQTFNDAAKAKAYLQQHNFPVVLKADGLAAGKGVIIAKSLEQANKTIDDMMSNRLFGKAGDSVVIEEFLKGEEASYIVMVDGENILPFASSQDHKARDNGDKGPNTGGMGAYSPAPVVTPELEQKILETVITPVIKGMKAEGHPYTGFLYAGLMISPSQEINVLEFNCRLGDPETQPLMMRLQSDLVTLCQQALARKLKQTNIEWDARTALGVVASADGYPFSYPKGDVINGLEEAIPQGKVFFAGIEKQQDQYVTSGGRVLCTCVLAENAAKAQKNVYQALNKVHFNGIYYRTDIGHRAIERETVRG